MENFPKEQQISVFKPYFSDPVSFKIHGPGRKLVHNEIPLNPGEAASLGQALIPQPHTNPAKARDCKGCHTRPKTVGRGINNGLFKTVVQQDRMIEVEDPKTGQIMADQSRSQIFEKQKFARGGLNTTVL